MNIPAGLIDNRIEFFSDPADQDKCFMISGGTVKRVKDASHETKKLIWEDIKTNPTKLKALIALGYLSSNTILEKYCSCCFGAFDNQADFEDGVFYHSEYVPCSYRAHCPGNGVLCNALTVGEGYELTTRQTDVLQLAGRCLLNKEIADHLNISEETVKIHIKNIQAKAGLMNKKDLVKLAIQKNLV